MVAKVGDYMTTEVAAVTPQDTLGAVRNIMLERKIKRVLVVQEERPIGIVTVDDLSRAWARRGAPWRWRRPESASVTRFMSRDLVTISPHASIVEAARVMVERGISGIPVVEAGRVVGIITKTDLLRYFAREMRGRFKVEDLMTRDVVTVRETDSVKKAAKLMKDKGISRLVVIGPDGRIKGVLTETDVAFVAPKRMRKFIVTDTHVGRSSREVRLGTVGDVMSNPVVTVRPDADASKAARIMLEWRISGLPVSPDGEELVGIVTKTDLVRGIAVGETS